MAAPTESTQPPSVQLARSVLLAAAALALIAGVGLAAAGSIRNPTFEGIAGSVFGGFVLALAIMGAGAWAAMSLMRRPAIPDTAGGEAIEADLKHVLAEVEAARLATVEQVNRRASWRVSNWSPACLASTSVKIESSR